MIHPPFLAHFCYFFYSFLFFTFSFHFFSPPPYPLSSCRSSPPLGPRFVHVGAAALGVPCNTATWGRMHIACSRPALAMSSLHKASPAPKDWPNCSCDAGACLPRHENHIHIGITHMHPAPSAAVVFSPLSLLLFDSFSHPLVFA